MKTIYEREKKNNLVNVFANALPVSKYFMNKYDIFGNQINLINFKKSSVNQYRF